MQQTVFVLFLLILLPSLIWGGFSFWQKITTLYANNDPTKVIGQWRLQTVANKDLASLGLASLQLEFQQGKQWRFGLL